MIAMFQPPTSKKPVAKAVYAFDEQSHARWVPINNSFITLSKIILQAAAERMGVRSIAVTLRCITHQGYRHLLLTGDGVDNTSSALGMAEEFIISNEVSLTPMRERLSDMDTVSVSMDYDGQRLGYLLATMPEHHLSAQTTNQTPRKFEADLHMVASELGSIITRYQTRYRAIFIYGDQNYWIGNSSALRHLDKKIELLRDETKPILIRANKGAGKSIAARTLHCLRHKNILPFIESSCNEWQDGAAASILQALYAYAKGGTLYLRNIDKLSAANLRILQRFLDTIKEEFAIKGASESVGIIFSVSRKYYSTVFELSGWLKQRTVELTLPDLSDRREDLRDLVSFFSQEYMLSVDFNFTESAWQLLEEFKWRENVDQLKSIIQKVALIAEEPLVTASLLEPLLKE